MGRIKHCACMFSVTLLLILLADLCLFPLSEGQLPRDSQERSKGSVVVLTAETPPELQIYHRALLLPRYRLERAHQVWDSLRTVNTDFFQVSLITVDGRGLRVEESPPNGSQYLRTPAYILFFFCLSELGCHLLRACKGRRERRKASNLQ